MSLKEDVVKEVIAKLESDGKTKKFKFPFGKKVGKGQRKKNYVTTMIINENGNVNFRKYQIEDQTITHDIIPRLATSGHVVYYKGNPMLILPNWSVEPFSPLEHYQKTLIDGSNTAGYKLLIAKMHKDQIIDKPKMGGWIKWVIGFVLLAIVVYAIISYGGK